MTEQTVRGRFIAEFRGGDNYDKSWEWCVIDEDEGFLGSAVLFDLHEPQARAVAEYLNRLTATEKEQ